MADDGKSGRLLLTNRVLKPVERRALKNLNDQVNRLEEKLKYGPSEDDLSAAATRTRGDTKRTKYAAQSDQLRQKKAAIKDIQAGALAKGKASPPSKTVMKATKQGSSLMTSSAKDTSKNIGGARGGMMVAINRWKDLFQ
jgi:hypothetical protein